MEDYPGKTPGDPGAKDTQTLVKEQVKQGTQQALDQTQQVAGQVVDQAKQQTTSALETQKTKATENLSSVVSALRSTGNQLREQDKAPIGQAADKAAEQLERISGYLEGRSVSDLVSEAEMYARRNPTVFLGGAFALGMIAARFLKSSSQQARSQSIRDYGRSNGYGPGSYDRYGYGQSTYRSGQYGYPSGEGASYGAYSSRYSDATAAAYSTDETAELDLRPHDGA